MILDLQMPHMTGLKVVQQLRKYYQMLPKNIIPPKYTIVSAYYSSAFECHLSKLDIKVCLEKPISSEQLSDLLIEGESNQINHAN